MAKYESFSIPYLVPERMARYTPDFLLKNYIIVETKGLFETSDRQKMILVKGQHPDLDIRMVFSNPNCKIRKGSPTTYAMWCQKNGFKFHKLVVPASWVNEPLCLVRKAAVMALLSA